MNQPDPQSGGSYLRDPDTGDLIPQQPPETDQSAEAGADTKE